MANHVLKIEPGSKAETYFVSEIMPNCKDEVIIRLGSDFGLSWNEYEITTEDYFRCQFYIRQKKGMA